MLLTCIEPSLRSMAGQGEKWHSAPVHGMPGCTVNNSYAEKQGPESCNLFNSLILPTTRSVSTLASSTNFSLQGPGPHDRHLGKLIRP